MIELVFGAIKMLIPIPDKQDAIATNAKGELRLTSENKYIAKEHKSIPVTDGPIVPMRSANRPLIGPKMANVIEPGNRYSAAVAVVNPNPDTRKKGSKKKVLELAVKDINLAEDPNENGNDLNKARGNIGFCAVFSLKRNPMKSKTESPVPKIM